jgi:putative addiction module component (TIGR02574 family)
MSNDELVRQLMTLPLSERVELAQILWESIESRPATSVPEQAEELLDLARRRDADFASGRVAGRTHAEVMAAARRALECT